MVWRNSDKGLTACRKYHKELVRLAKIQPEIFKSLLDNYMSNGKGTARCANGWTDVFCVPGKYSEFYVKLSDIAYKNNLFLEIAGNNIIRTLDKVQNFEFLNGTYLSDLNRY